MMVLCIGTQRQCLSEQGSSTELLIALVSLRYIHITSSFEFVSTNIFGENRSEELAGLVKTFQEPALLMEEPLSFKNLDLSLRAYAQAFPLGCAAAASFLFKVLCCSLVECRKVSLFSITDASFGNGIMKQFFRNNFCNYCTKSDF